MLHEQQPNLMEGQNLAGAGSVPLVSRGDIARFIEKANNLYNVMEHFPPNITPGIDLATTFAVMHAINKKGWSEGWEKQDLYFAYASTSAALSAAGFTNAKHSVNALLTGATGGVDGIINAIIPENTSGIIRFLAKYVVGKSTHLGNAREIVRILNQERRTEKRLSELLGLQQQFLLDPQRTQALLVLLNQKASLGLPPSDDRDDVLPETAKSYLTRISPFSLEDMRAVWKLFDAVEKWANTCMNAEAQRLKLDAFGYRLQAAGVNFGKFTSSTTAATTQTLLLGVGGLVGGTVGGLYLALQEARHRIKQALEKGRSNDSDSVSPSALLHK